MKLFFKVMIPLVLWIFLLYVIGLSVHKHWGSPYGWTIPMAFFTLGLREMIKTLKEIIGTSDKENTAPRTTPKDSAYTITQEDIEGDLHEGRD